MNRSTKQLLVVLSIAGFVLAAPFLVAHAALTDFNSLIAIINRVQSWLFWILMSLAVIFIIISAYLFLGSGGDPKKVEAAKNQLIYSIVAVAVALLAKAFISIVTAILT